MAIAEILRDSIRNGCPRVAPLHDPVNLARDFAGKGLVGDPLPVGFGPVDHVSRAREKLWMRIEVAPLLFLDTPLRPGGDLPLPILDLLIGQTFRTHVLADCALHGISGVPVIVEPFHHSAIFNDTVFPQDPRPLQCDAELHMGPVERLARRLQIRAALEVETDPLGHPRQIVGDPLALERGVLCARLHPRDDDGRTDPGPAQRRVDLRPHLGVPQPVEPGRIDIGLGIDPALRGLLGERYGTKPQRLHMRQPGLDLVEAPLESRPLRLRLRLDHALDARDLIGITGPQILERLLLCHVDASFQIQLAAPRQELSGPEERVGDILAIVRGSFGSKGVIDDPGVGDLFERAIQVRPDPWTRFRNPPLSLGGVDLAGPRRIVHDAAIEPPRGLEAHPEPLGLLDHGEAEIVVVEPVVPAQEEELALLRTAVQDYMRVGVIPVLMDRDDVVEMPFVGLEEPLRNIGGDVAHILAPCPDRVGHEHMCRLSKLGLEPGTPALREPLCQVLDLRPFEFHLPVQKAARVDDMGRLRGEVI